MNAVGALLRSPVQFGTSANPVSGSAEVTRAQIRSSQGSVCYLWTRIDSYKRVSFIRSFVRSFIIV